VITCAIFSTDQAGLNYLGREELPENYDQEEQEARLRDEHCADCICIVTEHELRRWKKDGLFAGL